MTLKFNPFTNKLDITETGGAGGGDVSGPGSSTDNAVVRWSGTTGTTVQNSVVTISDTGDIIANSIDLTIPVSVADGGTDISSYTTGDILYASGAGTLTKLAIGSASDVLTVTGGLPSWQPSIGGGTVTSVSGTANRITSTGGATPVIDISASYVGQSSITTLGTITTGVWTGTDVALADGGTGASLTASNGGIFYSTAGAGAILLGTATAGQLLTSGASTTPAWTTSTYPATNAVSTLLYASSTNVMAALATANNGLLVTSATGVPSILAGPGTTGNILQSNAAAAPSFSTATYPATTTVSQILYSSATNVVSGLATANRAVLTTGSTGVPVLTALTDGQLIIGSTAGAPAAASLTAGANITITPGSNSITIAATGGGASPLTTKGDLFTFSTVDARLPVGANGTILTADSTATTGNKWTTATYPATATGTGKVLIADGTNWVASTPTYPNASASTGKFIISDGTNFIASTPTLPNSATGTGTILRADGTNWVASTATYPNTATTGDLLYASASNVYSNLTVGTSKGRSVITDGSLPLYIDPNQYIYWFDDFFGTQTNNMLSTYGWTAVTGGGSILVNAAANIESGHPGIVSVVTSSSATGSAYFKQFAGNDLGMYYAGTGEIICTFLIKVTTLSTTSETFSIAIGIYDTQAINQAMGCYFKYTDTGSSPNWDIVTANAGTRTTTTTATAVGTGWSKLQIIVNAGGTSVAYYIDGVQVSGSPLSTNIPTGDIAPGITIIKSNGTTQRELKIDYCEFYQKLTTPR